MSANNDEPGDPPAPQGRSRRWRALLDLLADQGSLSVTTTAARFGVSAATIRRDFARLEQQQLVTRTHGGVVAAAVAYDLPARYRRERDDHPKARIAAAAARLVTPGMVVGFNGGTTTTATARQMAASEDLATGRDGAVTVVTNALNIASELVLRPHLRTICIGGSAVRESYELYGPFADRLLADLHMDVLFLGVSGFSARDGATCPHLGESGTNAAMVAHADRVVVVTTAAKLGRSALARICPVTEVDALITDTDAHPEPLTALRTAGVDVQTV